MAEELSAPQSKRIVSIDRFRGLCMLFVVISVFLGEVFPQQFSKWSFLFAHGGDGFQFLGGIALADIFAPMLIFVIGLTARKSFDAKEAKVGTKKAYWQFALRYLGLIGVGALLNGLFSGWGDVLQGDDFALLRVSVKVFTIGFLVGIAFLIIFLISRLTKKEKFKTVCAAALRYFFALSGLVCIYFLILGTGEQVAGQQISKYGWVWDTLQNIGLAGLVALPFIKFDRLGRLVTVGVTFAVMTVFVQNGGLSLVSAILEGGLFGSLSWAGILLLGSVFSETKSKKEYWALTLILLLIPVVLILAFGFIAQKRGATPMYAMFTAGLSAVVWAVFELFNNWQPRFKLLTWWGSSALFIYLINFLMCILIGLPFLLTDTIIPLWAAVLIIAVMIGLYSVMNWLLVKHKKYIRL